MKLTARQRPVHGCPLRRLRARYPLNRFQKAIRPRDLARILREVRAGVKHQLMTMLQRYHAHL